MKVLITGASGLLGRAVHQHCLDLQHEILALAHTRCDPAKGHTKLDLTDNDALTACLGSFAPDLIVHTAAERRPDVVEKDAAACHTINVQVPANIAKAAAALATVPLLINISTDYVFDGSKPPYKVDDEPNPLNAYGVSKLQGERAIAQNAVAGRYTNLRVPVLYGETLTNTESAVNCLLDAIMEPTTMRKCDAYAVRYPTCVADIAVAILSLATTFASTGQDVPGITQFSAKEAMTKYDMCMVLSRIANSVGFDTRTDLLEPEYEVDPLAATARPRHCKLDTSVLSDYGVPIKTTFFEDWWNPYLAKQYSEKLEREAKAAEAARAKEEEEARLRKIEEEEREKKLKEEAEKQRKIKEEEDRQQKNKQEEEERQQEEEEKQRKIRDEAEKHDEESTAQQRQEETLPHEGGASVDEPNTISPRPSLNSLKARPTPPATSRISSPTSSHPPSSIRSAHRPESPHLETTSASTGPVVHDSPLNLAAAAEKQRLGQISHPTSSESRKTSLTDESTMFGGHASAKDATLLSASAAASHRGEESDEDDGYGQPSPREPQKQFQGATAAGDDTDKALPASDDAAEASTSPQPKIYHRPSFDLLQDARDREAYERLHRRQFEFSIKVGDPQKIGDPMTAHIVYTVRSHTNSLAFRSSQFSVLRRYRDFRWLHAALVQNNPGIIVPPVPEKVSIGRFAAELVEARRMGLETCINKVASHPLLQQDDDFRLFLESDNFAADVKHRDMIKGPVETPEQKTYRSWGSVLFGNVVSSTSSLSSGALSAYRFEEMDEWFNEQKMYLDSLESALKGLVKSISALSNQHKHIVQCTQNLSEVLLVLSGSSLSRSLSTCFAGLAEVERRLWELEDGQAEVDVRHIGTTMYEYERVVGSVRKAFQVRTEIWARSARAEDEVRRTRSRFEKYKSANPTSSGPQFQLLLAELTESETKSLEAARLFDTVSRRCKDEMERLDLERVLDFKKIVAMWLDDMIARQEEVVQEWIQYCSLLSRQTGIQVLSSPEPPTQTGGEPTAAAAAGPAPAADDGDAKVNAEAENQESAVTTEAAPVVEQPDVAKQDLTNGNMVAGTDNGVQKQENAQPAQSSS